MNKFAYNLNNYEIGIYPFILINEITSYFFVESKFVEYATYQNGYKHFNEGFKILEYV